jgi:hypothetical protein
MTKLINVKLLRSLWLLISFSLFCCLIACGGSKDTTSGTGTNTTTTVTPTITSFTASVSSLSAGQSSILTVTVTDGSGNALSGQTVNFSFASNQSNATVAALNGGVTDGNGHALALYTAGSLNPTSEYNDSVQATCGSSTGALIIDRTASTASSTTGYTVTVSSSVASLAQGQNSIITATVTNGSGVAAAGVAVTFITTTNNNSGYTLAVLGGGGSLIATTDASGKATAIYKAGTTNPTADVQDTVTASVPSGTTTAYGVVLITRTGTSTTLTGYQVTLTANPSSLAAGQNSIITATVRNSSGTVASDIPVTFSLPASSSGSLSVLSGTTDASGSFSTIYTAGSSITSSVQDVVNVNVNGGQAFGAVILTITAPSSSSAGYIITLVANPNAVPAANYSILTATVTDGSGNPVKNMPVSFTFLQNNSGTTYILASGNTDAKGQFNTLYLAGSSAPGTNVEDVVSASITSGGYSASAAVIITRTGVTNTTGFQILSFDASPNALSSGQSSILTVTVYNGSGNPVSGQTVNFGFASQTIPTGSTLTTIGGTTGTTATGVTDASGKAVAIYIAGSTSSTMSLEDTVTASCGTAVAASIITRTASSTGSYNVALSATISSLKAGQSSIITAVVTDSSGTPAVGQTVTFDTTINNNSGYTLAALGGGLTAITDASGTAIAVYTAGTNSPTTEVEDTVMASVNSGAAYGAVIITRTVGSTCSGYQETLTSSTQSLTAGENSIVTVTVKDCSGNIAIGVPVTFSITTSSGGTLSVSSGITDASGSFSTIYTAGSGGSSGSVQDVIGVNVDSGVAFGADIITRTQTSTAGYKMTLAANPDTVSVGNYSILTANLMDSSGTAVPNMTVTFNYSINNSGGIMCNAVSGTCTGGGTKTVAGVTDANGNANITYIAGSTAGQDVIYATFTNGTYSANAALIMPVTSATGSSGSTSGTPSITLVLTDNVVSYGTPVTAYATLRDATGALVPNAVVSFTATSALVTFTPISATALTNASGVAAISINAADVSSAGATSITAASQVTSGTTTTSVTSMPIGIAVNGATVTLGSITLGSNTISAYGSTSVQIPVYIDSVAANVPMSVTLTSPCVADQKATVTNPVTNSAATGIATSTYTDKGCGTGTDTITASVSGASANAMITVAVPAANNIQFISATPSIIGTSVASARTLQTSSVVIFRVVDSNGNGVNGQTVNFSVVPASKPGGLSLSASSQISSNNGTGDGYVTVGLTSGTVPTPVWVVAKLVTASGTLTSQSNVLTITTGLPTENFFSLAAATHNIEGWLYDGVTSALTIIASDRLGNPVPDGTAVNFNTEGSQVVPASCTTGSGTCTVTFTSSAYRPINETPGVEATDWMGNPIVIGGHILYVVNGRVTLVAYSLGEESFIDTMDVGQNVYAVGDTFYDLGDIYIDANENGQYDSGETFIPLGLGTKPCGTETYSGTPPTGAYVKSAYTANYSNVPSKQNTCSGLWDENSSSTVITNYVRRSQVMILSDSFAQTPPTTTFAMGGLCVNTFTTMLMDRNGNPMPAGTTITTTNNYIYYTPYSSSIPPTSTPTLASISVSGGSPVNDSNHAGGTPITFTVAADCTAGTPIAYPAGSAVLVVTTPKGNVTNIGVTVE